MKFNISDGQTDIQMWSCIFTAKNTSNFVQRLPVRPLLCLLLKPSPKTKHSPKNVLKLSPESSRSSSRNSSVSPRERTFSNSMKNSSNRASPPGHSSNSSSLTNKKQTGNAATAAATAAAAQTAKSRSGSDNNKARPVVPWSKRNMGPPKNCNGWAWVGEGSEQKVYLNVSY